MSNEFKFNIGDSVYSPKFGLGKVLIVDFMEGADTHFYVIESFVNHTKLMVPVEASKKTTSLGRNQRRSEQNAWCILQAS